MTDKAVDSMETQQPNRRLVALVHDVHVRANIEQAAQTLGDEIEFAPTATDIDVVAYLVARQPPLILVHLRVPDWRAFVLAAKTSPATRKLPVLAFGPADPPALLKQAQFAGCDGIISEGDFEADVAGHIQHYARPDERAELARQAQLPLPALAHEAIEQFNQREFFEQHELFETLWRAEPGPVRQMYQGLLQVGVAYLQIQRGNYIGARKLFQRARQYLSVLPEVCQGVDIRQFNADTAAAEVELDRLGPNRIGEFSAVLFKTIKQI